MLIWEGMFLLLGEVVQWNNLTNRLILILIPRHSSHTHMMNAITRHTRGRQEGIIASGVDPNPLPAKKKKVKKKRRERQPYDPIAEVYNRYMKDPLVIEAMEY